MENNAIIQEYQQLTRKETKTEYDINGKINIKVTKNELKRGLKEKLTQKHQKAFIYEYCLSLK